VRSGRRRGRPARADPARRDDTVVTRARGLDPGRGPLRSPRGEPLVEASGKLPADAAAALVGQDEDEHLGCVGIVDELDGQTGEADGSLPVDGEEAFGRPLGQVGPCPMEGGFVGGVPTGTVDQEVVVGAYQLAVGVPEVVGLLGQRDVDDGNGHEVSSGGERGVFGRATDAEPVRLKASARSATESEHGASLP